MLLDPTELIYVLLLELGNHLMLVLRFLCEQLILFYHANCMQGDCIF